MKAFIHWIPSMATLDIVVWETSICLTSHIVKRQARRKVYPAKADVGRSPGKIEYKLQRLHLILCRWKGSSKTDIYCRCTTGNFTWRNGKIQRQATWRILCIGFAGWRSINTQASTAACSSFYSKILRII